MNTERESIVLHSKARHRGRSLSADDAAFFVSGEAIAAPTSTLVATLSGRKEACICAKEMYREIRDECNRVLLDTEVALFEPIRRLLVMLRSSQGI